MDVLPSSVVVGNCAQRHLGYCISHVLSAASKAAFSAILIPMAVSVPQQLI